MESLLGWFSLVGILLWTRILTEVIKVQNIEKRFQRHVEAEDQAFMEKWSQDPASKTAKLVFGGQSPEHVKLERFLRLAEIGIFAVIFAFLINLLLWASGNLIHPAWRDIVRGLQVALTIAATVLCFAIPVRSKLEVKRASAYLLAQMEVESK